MACHLTLQCIAIACWLSSNVITTKIGENDAAQFFTSIDINAWGFHKPNLSLLPLSQQFWNTQKWRTNSDPTKCSQIPIFWVLCSNLYLNLKNSSHPNQLPQIFAKVSELAWCAFQEIILDSRIDGSRAKTTRLGLCVVKNDATWPLVHQWTAFFPFILSLTSLAHGAIRNFLFVRDITLVWVDVCAKVYMLVKCFNSFSRRLLQLWVQLYFEDRNPSFTHCLKIRQNVSF